jgi:hypothetical protein
VISKIGELAVTYQAAKKGNLSYLGEDQVVHDSGGYELRHSSSTWIYYRSR